MVLLMASNTFTYAGAQTLTCESFDAWIWAQAVFDQDPQRAAQLDPDGNGIACEHLTVNGFSPAFWADGIPNQGRTFAAELVSVADGDTINVRYENGQTETVRLLHMDTPETGGTIGQCGGTESTDFLTWILSYAKNRTVYLETDQTTHDRYDRRLAYVWFEVEGDPNPYMANFSMILSGWAESETYEPDVKYKEQLDWAEQFSVEHVTGVRLQCGKFGRPANDAGPSNEQIRQAHLKQPNQGQLPPYPTTTAGTTEEPSAPQPTQEPAPPPAQQNASCDPSYPDVCIPPYNQVGDLDCGDVGYRRFRVVPSDSHGFDGDFDGVGCEGG